MILLHFKFFKRCLSQIFLGPFFNTFPHIFHKTIFKKPLKDWTLEWLKVKMRDRLKPDLFIDCFQD